MDTSLWKTNPTPTSKDSFPKFLPDYKHSTGAHRHRRHPNQGPDQNQEGNPLHVPETKTLSSTSQKRKVVVMQNKS